MSCKRIFVATCLVFCFAMGFAFGRIPEFVHNHLGIGVDTFIKSPLAYWRVQKRGWDFFRALDYTQDRGACIFTEMSRPFFSH